VTFHGDKVELQIIKATNESARPIVEHFYPQERPLEVESVVEITREEFQRCIVDK
jgi:predicted DNA-binding protein (UPF0251 family)